MAVYKEIIKLQSHGTTPSFIDVTEEVKGIIERSKIQNGVVFVISPHTTCSVFFEEFSHDVLEDGTDFLTHDLNACLKKIIPDETELPPNGQYLYPGEAHFEAVEAWPDAALYLPNGDRKALLNGDAHIKSSIIGSSTTMEVDNGKLVINTTGHIFFADFDRAPGGRARKCRVVVMGE